MKISFKPRELAAAIDFSNGWIKIIRTENAQSRLRFIDIAAVKFPRISCKEFGKAIRSLLKSKPAVVIISIPRQSIMVKFLNLPSTIEPEIEKMLEFQAVKQLPFSGEDIVIGYKILYAGKNGYSKVMAAIAQKNVINEYFDLLKSAGLTPEAFYLSSEAVLNCFLHTGTERKITVPGLYMLLNIDGLFTELLICEGTKILFCRAFAQGAASLYEAVSQAQIEAWAAGLTEHVKFSLKAFKKIKNTEDKTIDQIFLLGGIYKFFKNMEEIFCRELSTPTKYVNVLEKLTISGGSNAMLLSQMQKPLSFSSVIGIAADKDALKINLVPKELKARRLYKQKQAAFLKLWFLLGGIFLCFSVLLGSRFFYKQARLQYLNGQLSKTRPDAEKINMTIEKLKAINRHADIDKTPLEILREIYVITPPDIRLYSFSFQDGKTAVFRGTSGAMSNIFKMVVALEKSELFRNVKVTFANKRKIKTGEAVDFQLDCFLK